jgi:4-hydroxy-3-methylbut-2-enyl diphosphate reductase
MKPFGAFVELSNGLEGLVHISNITYKRISKPQDVLEMGQMVTAKVVEIDLDKKRIELSIREMEERMPEEEPANQAQEQAEKEPTEKSEEKAPATEETVLKDAEGEQLEILPTENTEAKE